MQGQQISILLISIRSGGPEHIRVLEGWLSAPIFSHRNHDHHLTCRGRTEAGEVADVFDRTAPPSSESEGDEAPAPWQR